MREGLNQVWMVAERELRDQLRDWRILFPMIVLTVFFPYLMNATAQVAVNFVNRYGGGLIGERIIPFLLMVVGFFPITISLVVALEAFVGEKERGTIEPLLSSPISDAQLYLGKLLASTIIPLLAAYVGIAVYLFGILRQGVPLPPPVVMLQMVILTGLQALLMVSGAIVISAQSTSVRAANLLASFIVIPVGLLIQGESILMFWGNNQALWFAVAAVAIIAVLLIRLGLAHFQRESLIGREIDMLNFRWMGQTFKNRFVGEAQSIFQWYRLEIPKTLRNMRVTILVTLLIGIVTAVSASIYVDAKLAEFNVQIDKSQTQAAINQIEKTIYPGNLNFTASGIFFNNIRAMLVALLLGLVTFGVLGIIVYMVNISLVGGVLSVVSFLGYSPFLVLVMGILPHGVFELAAVVLSCAAIFHIGVKLVTPDQERTFGQVYIEGIADWTKVMLGVSLPLLLIAALIEVNITPLLLIGVLK